MIYQLEILAGVEPAITLRKFFLVQTVFALANEGDAPTERKIGANSLSVYRSLVPCGRRGRGGGKKQTLLFEFSNIHSVTAFRFDGHLVLKLML